MSARTKKRASATAAAGASIRPEEISRFSELAERWWDENGPMKPLHRLNPCRLGYISDRVRAHFGPAHAKSLRLLDIGCGAGLVAENMAKEGYSVTGLDASAELIAAATAHAQAGGVSVTYRHGSAEALAAERRRFDIVLALEVIEHVADPAAFAATAARLVAPGGLLIVSTLNRTLKGLALGVVAAEYLLRLVPAGTHDWRAFVKPSELAEWVETSGLTVSDVCGLVYDPLADRFALNPRDVAVNYFLTAEKTT